MAREYNEEHAGYHARRDREREKLTKTLIKVTIAVAVFLGIITLMMGIFNIAEYERGIITRWGKFQRIAQPGLNFKTPWVDGLETIDMRVKSPRFENMESYTYDQQLTKVDVSITLEPRESQLQQLYSRYRNIQGAIDALLKPYMPTYSKIVLGRYTSSSVIKDREKFNLEVKNEVVNSLGENPVFNILSVNVEDIEFSQDYVKTIEERMKAEVEVLKVRQNLERERVTAEIVKTQADAKAYQVEANGKAEASAIDAVGKALASQPLYVEKLKAERWDGALPKTMVPNTATPFISIK